MEHALKIPCAQCRLDPNDRVLYEEIVKLIQQHGFKCAVLSEIEMQSSRHIRRGLCVTCNKRDECADAFREGGVWHCTDYM